MGTTAVCTLRLVALSVIAAASGGAACATLVHGRHQEVLVESSPSGAQVTWNGRGAGVTPTTIRMARRGQVALRLELPGHVATTVTVPRRLAGWWSANLVFLNPMAAQGQSSSSNWAATALLLTASGLGADVLLGGAFERPPRIAVDLVPASLATASGDPERPQPSSLATGVSMSPLRDRFRRGRARPRSPGLPSDNKADTPLGLPSQADVACHVPPCRQTPAHAHACRGRELPVDVRASTEPLTAPADARRCHEIGNRSPSAPRIAQVDRGGACRHHLACPLEAMLIDHFRADGDPRAEGDAGSTASKDAIVPDVVDVTGVAGRQLNADGSRLGCGDVDDRRPNRHAERQ